MADKFSYNEVFSVQPPCSLCLCGVKVTRKFNHRDTENTEVAQRRIQNTGPALTS